MRKRLTSAPEISQERLQQLVHLIAAGREDLFYRWPEWLARRQDVLQLDRRECQRCRQVHHRYRKATLVHHAKHLTERPDLALSIWDGQERQLVSLCEQCHEEEHPEHRKHFQRRVPTPVTTERWD